MFYDITGFDNYEVDPFNCIIRNKTTGYVLRPHLDGGYPRIQITNNTGNSKNIYCHRLFMELLDGSGEEVNHKDGNKLNWHISNLELLTHQENVLHCSKVLNRSIPFNHKGSKEVYVVDLRTDEEKLFPSTNEVARLLVDEYGIKFRDAESYVYRIIKGYRKVKTYRDYTFYRKEYEVDLSEFVAYDEYYLVSKEGEIYSLKTNKLLSKTIQNGYATVKLYNKTIKIHRIIAEVFIPNPDKLPVVDHIDRDKLNNNVSNLRWASHQDNNINAERPIYRGIESAFSKPIIGFNETGVVHIFEKITDVKNIGLSRHKVRKHIRSETEYNGLYWKDVSIEEYFKLI